MANTNTTPHESALGKQLAEEAKFAAFRKTISEANEAEAKAEKQTVDNHKAIKENQRNDLKGPDIKPLDGKVTAAGNYVETRLLSNKLLDVLITKLVDEMFASNSFNNTDRFVIYYPSSIPLMEMCYTLTFQLKAFDQDLDALISRNQQLLSPANVTQREDGGAAPLIVGLAGSGLLRTAADIFSLFRTDSTITNTDLAKDENLVTTCFAQAFIKKSTGKLYYPSTFPAILFSCSEVTPVFVSLYSKVKSKNCQAVELQRQLDALVSEIDGNLALETDLAKVSQLQAQRQIYNQASVQIAGVNVAFTQMESMLLTIDQTTKVSLLSVLVHSEQLKELLLEETTYTIKMDADLSGSSVVRQNFFTGTKLTHTGGARLSCLIFERDGAIKFSYNAVNYSEEMVSPEIKKLVNN